MYGIFTYMNGCFFYGFHVGKYTGPMDPMIRSLPMGHGWVLQAAEAGKVGKLGEDAD